MKNKQFLILLKGNENQMANFIETKQGNPLLKWEIYLKNLAKHGHLISGLPLENTGRLVNKTSDFKKKEWNTSEKSINGYLIISAKDYSQAVELIKKCPTIEYGGNAEIRQMASMEK